eukprot:gnl/Dysnectes_brevis/4106_a5396_720.p1 GENE.gnl/Dysnectes_brevis/4106_a5396_720~~gnl/Dysnectes_brevis/4106_a5396_720.p1  ORF type:complete len:305 (+),score=15.74 gnl/Dysnectes_brevis/4106_a5396_720:148-1062(+)
MDKKQSSIKFKPSTDLSTLISATVSDLDAEMKEMQAKQTNLLVSLDKHKATSLTSHISHIRVDEQKLKELRLHLNSFFTSFSSLFTSTGPTLGKLLDVYLLRLHKAAQGAQGKETGTSKATTTSAVNSDIISKIQIIRDQFPSIESILHNYSQWMLLDPLTFEDSGIHNHIDILITPVAVMDLVLSCQWTPYVTLITTIPWNHVFEQHMCNAKQYTDKQRSHFKHLRASVINQSVLQLVARMTTDVNQLIDWARTVIAISLKDDLKGKEINPEFISKLLSLPEQHIDVIRHLDGVMTALPQLFV